jgi:hypothetical protein
LLQKLYPFYVKEAESLGERRERREKFLGS